MKISQLFNPKYWTRLSAAGRPESDDLRRDILFSQILIVGLIISLLHFLNDLFHANPQAYVIDAFFVLFLAVFYILNERGAHRLAKFLDLTLLNLLIFLLAAILDERIRMSYNFFPLAILSFLVFYKSELYLSILFSTMSLVLLVILEFTDYQPFGDIAIKEGVDQVTLLINILGSFILLVMGLVFLVKLNIKAEFELKKKEVHLTKINEELDRFVYSASHDLRAPLLSVKGLTNLVRYEKINANVVDYIGKIEGRVNDLDRFIAEIIDHSRNSRLEVVKERFPLEPLVDEVIEKLRYMDKMGDIEFMKKMDLEKVFSDRVRLNIILSNLLANAIKYSDPQKVKKWIKIRLYGHKKLTVIEVSDNGIGIEREHIPSVYNMFFRADKSSSGSGLGLYIVKEMIEKLGGDIFVESEFGSGTSFKVILPTS